MGDFKHLIFLTLDITIKYYCTYKISIIYFNLIIKETRSKRKDIQFDQNKDTTKFAYNL